MQGVRDTAAEDAGLDNGEESRVATLAGRVLAAFVMLIVLSAFVIAMVALAYWSKQGLPRPLHPQPAGQASAISSVV